MTKRFGAFAALDDVSLKVAPGTFHALLGENGAGKSTLVKCIMGYYQPDDGELMVDDRAAGHRQSARRARARPRHGLSAFHAGAGDDRRRKSGAVARPMCRSVIDWRRSARRSTSFWRACRSACRSTPRSRRSAAGEKQKCEILKQLYLERRFLILDEPTSVLTPGEADEVLGMLRGMVDARRRSPC